MTPSTAPALRYARIAVRDGVGTLTLNRPDRLNAFEGEMPTDVLAATHSLVEDESVRVIVLTGEGRGFCAGADVRYLEECVRTRQYTEATSLLARMNEVVRLLAGTPKPVLGSINGAAAGGGASLALACDLRIASSQASMGFVFRRLGLVPDMGATHTLPALVGPSMAMELFWQGDMLPAGECLRLGLVNRVVPHEELPAATAAWATELAQLPIFSTKVTKAAVRGGKPSALEAALKMEFAAQADCFQSADAAEGLAAFAAKRPARFADR
jgi:2-(1,2-epoxy-1,2-dihydrophenyl)acetyl-CoA isomerase